MNDRLFYPLMYVVCGLLLMAGLLLFKLAHLANS